MHCFPWASRGSAISRRAGTHHTVTVPYEDKHHYPKLPPLPPTLCTEHDIILSVISLWSLVQAVSSPPNLPGRPSFLDSMASMKSRKGLGSVQAQLSNNKISPYYQPHAQRKSVTLPRTSHWKKLTQLKLAHSFITKKKNNQPFQMQFSDNNSFLRKAKQTMNSETKGCPE